MAADSFSDVSKKLHDDYGRFMVDAFPARSFPPGLLQKELEALVHKSSGLTSGSIAGRSFEGREIRTVVAGTGKTNVLLWSQMHGDESTATMAICDIINYISEERDKEVPRTILRSLSLVFLPMLNPDGAARTQRRTAQNIDMNRDALALVTPEARILRDLQNKIKPQYGFNLHDQELSTVGSSNEIAAIGLLVPSLDHQRSDSGLRNRAKRIASVFSSAIGRYVTGKVTKYDDSHEPRAFGDNMLKWGTSVLLVESGHSPDDPEKCLIRKLNFIGILATLYAVATGESERTDITPYENLPFNGKRAYDVIIRNVTIEYSGGISVRSDLGVSYQVDTHPEPPPMLADIGDLRTFGGLREIDGKGKIIPQSSLAIGRKFEWENYFGM